MVLDERMVNQYCIGNSFTYKRVYTTERSGSSRIVGLYHEVHFWIRLWNILCETDSILKPFSWVIPSTVW